MDSEARREFCFSVWEQIGYEWSGPGNFPSAEEMQFSKMYRAIDQAFTDIFTAAVHDKFKE